MTPQPRGAVPAQNVRKIRSALAAKSRSQQHLETAVTEALEAGGSVREVAAISGLSTTTVQKYKRGNTDG